MQRPRVTEVLNPLYLLWHHDMQPLTSILVFGRGIPRSRVHSVHKEPVHDDVIKWKHFPRNWPLVPGIHRPQRQVTLSFDVFFDLLLNELLSKLWRDWWFETPSRPLWLYCNEWGCFVNSVLLSPTSCCSNIIIIKQSFCRSKRREFVWLMVFHAIEYTYIGIHNFKINLVTSSLGAL